MHTNVEKGGDIRSRPSGIACGFASEVCEARFADNQLIELEATPVSFAVFSHWTSIEGSDGCSGSAPVITLLMDQDRTCRAEFRTTTTAFVSVNVTQEVDMQAPGTGSYGGVIVSQPPGIVCGSPGVLDDCSMMVVSLTNVQREVSSIQAGYQFDGWSGCSSSVARIINVAAVTQTDCVAMFSTAPVGPTSNVSLVFDGYNGVIRGLNTGQLNCNTNCVVALPRNESRIRLLAEGGQPTFTGCDAVTDTSAGRECEIDISGGDVGVLIEN